MKKVGYLMMLLFFFASAIALSGQEIETETFLVPISLHRGDGPIPGAFDSLWTSTLFFRNETPHDVTVSPHYLIAVPAHATSSRSVRGRRSSWNCWDS